LLYLYCYVFLSPQETKEKDTPVTANSRSQGRELFQTVLGAWRQYNLLHYFNIQKSWNMKFWSTWAH